MRISKKIAALAIVGSALAAGSAAFAYWQTSGSGTGSAAVSSTAGTLGLSATVPSGIVPGGSEPVSFTAFNSNQTDLYVGTVHATGFAVDSGHSTCSVGDFSMADVVENQVVPHANFPGGTALTNKGSLVFANSSSSQDACQGATITISLSSN